MRILLSFLLVALTQTACAQGSAPNSPPNGSPPAPIHPNCLPGKTATTRKVTHYYVPLLESYSHFTCDKMEGTCIYNKVKVPWLHNFGYEDQPLADARCKNGYGNKQNCLNPCRTIAANNRYHRFGEVHFIPALVGKKCGSPRDGTEMIHDGYVVVGDTGAPSHFDAPGRFDFFWGRCRDRSNGVCHEGAYPISRDATESPYCMVWNPADPLKNVDIKVAFQNKVIQEAIDRGDQGAAQDFDLDKYVGKGAEPPPP